MQRKRMKPVSEMSKGEMEQAKKEGIQMLLPPVYLYSSLIGEWGFGLVNIPDHSFKMQRGQCSCSQFEPIFLKGDVKKTCTMWYMSLLRVR